MLFWVLATVFSAGLTYSGWQADNLLYNELTTIGFSSDSRDNLPQSFRTLFAQTRGAAEKGILNEHVNFVPGAKNEILPHLNRLPSFSSSKSLLTLSKNHQPEFQKFNSPQLTINQILRI